MYVAEVSQIAPDDLEKLFYNGFDNPESIELAKKQDLEELGIENADDVLTRLQVTVQYYRESGTDQEAAACDNNPDMFSYEDSEIQMPELPKNARNLSYDLLLGDMKNHSTLKHKPYLDAMTHLMMNKKRLSSII